MRSLRPLFIFMILLITFTSILAQAADVSPSCELEAMPLSTRFVHAVEINLRERTLTSEDVKYMIENGPALSNPWDRKETNPSNLALKNSFIRILTKVPDRDVAWVKSQLSTLLSGSEQTKADLTKAKSNTSAVLNPKLRGDIANADVHEDLPIWHRDAQGNLQLVLYTSHNFHLQIFDPETGQLLYRKNLESPQKREKRSHSILSTPEGGLWVTQNFSESANLALVDVSNDKTYYYNRQNFASAYVALARGKAGQVYLIALGRNEASTFEIQNGKLILINTTTFSTPVAGKYKVMNSPEGRIVVVAQSGTDVYVFKPLEDSRASRFFGSGEIRHLDAAIDRNGDYVVAINRRNGREPKDFELLISGRTFKIGDTFVSWGSLTRTHDGQIRLAIRQSRTHEGEGIAIYDPLNLNIERLTLWDKVRRKIPQLLPTRILTSRGMSTQLLKWVRAADDRDWLIQFTDLNSQFHVAIFDPESQDEAIAAVPISNTSLPSNLHVQLLKDTGQMITIADQANPPLMNIYEGTESPAHVLRAPIEQFTQVERSRSGEYFLAGITSKTANREGKLHLVHLTQRMLREP